MEWYSIAWLICGVVTFFILRFLFGKKTVNIGSFIGSLVFGPIGLLMTFGAAIAAVFITDNMWR